MNRRELLALLPKPEDIGALEYTAVHNMLVDAVNDWVVHPEEDITLFVSTVLTETREWATYISNLIERTDESGKNPEGQPDV
jgi:hypothetical protein